MKPIFEVFYYEPIRAIIKRLAVNEKKELLTK